MSFQFTDEEICQVVIDDKTELDIAVERCLNQMKEYDIKIKSYILTGNIIHDLVGYQQDGMSLEQAAEHVIETYK